MTQETKLKLKLIVGFRKEQHYTIDADEAHKAYYLFLNPDKRAVFSNGVAVIGQDIRGIVPDYNAMMGWSPDYNLDSYDWGDFKIKKLKRECSEIMQKAKLVATQMISQGDMRKINIPLTEVLLSLPAAKE